VCVCYCSTQGKLDASIDQVTGFVTQTTGAHRAKCIHI
jgi:hypothetical protein